MKNMRPDLDKTFQAYMTNVAAYYLREKIMGAEPNETFMRMVEGQMGIPEQGADEFRRDVMAKPVAMFILSETNAPGSMGDEPDWPEMYPGLEAAIQFAKDNGY